MTSCQTRQLIPLIKLRDFFLVPHSNLLNSIHPLSRLSTSALDLWSTRRTFRRLIVSYLFRLLTSSLFLLLSNTTRVIIFIPHFNRLTLEYLIFFSSIPFYNPILTSMSLLIGRPVETYVTWRSFGHTTVWTLKWVGVQRWMCVRVKSDKVTKERVTCCGLSGSIRLDITSSVRTTKVVEVREWWLGSGQLKWQGYREFRDGKKSRGTGR